MASPSKHRCSGRSICPSVSISTVQPSSSNPPATTVIRTGLVGHVNDFEVTPIVFRDGDGRLMEFHRYRPQPLNPLLWRWSYLYRYLKGIEGRRRLRNLVEDEMAVEIEAALERLRAATERDGARLSVLILPLLGTTDDLPAHWADGAAHRVDLAARILARQGIRAFDLTTPHRRALADGLAVREAPHDPMHPSRFVAERFADFLMEAGLFDAELAATAAGDGGG